MMFSVTGIAPATARKRVTAKLQPPSPGAAVDVGTTLPLPHDPRHLGVPARLGVVEPKHAVTEGADREGRRPRGLYQAMCHLAPSRTRATLKADDAEAEGGGAVLIHQAETGTEGITYTPADLTPAGSTARLFQGVEDSQNS